MPFIVLMYPEHVTLSALTVQELARIFAMHSFVHRDLEMMLIRWGMMVASWNRA